MAFASSDRMGQVQPRSSPIGGCAGAAMLPMDEEKPQGSTYRARDGFRSHKGVVVDTTQHNQPASPPPPYAQPQAAYYPQMVQPVAVPQPAATPKSSGLAIASLVL